MNLLTSAWIPVRRQDNSVTVIAPYQLGETENPVMEIQAPRADFQGGLYQWLIGLLQTCYAPADPDQWCDEYELPPSCEQLQTAFAPYIPAFELFNAEGPAFLQDFDPDMGVDTGIAALLIEAPGEQTIKNNTDLFIKRGEVNTLCSSCAASALFTFMTNAPSGGAGHRVGLRGGGPLTTLIRPREREATLWQKLWLNVLDAEDREYTPASQRLDPLVFPLLAPTRISDKSGGVTTPEHGHWLQHYWGMPRRIRLQPDPQPRPCDLCQCQSEVSFSQFRMQNYGVNYDGAWRHPLTPYRVDLKGKNPPLSLKGQPGGLGYRHWLGMVLQDPSNGDEAARLVTVYMHQRWRLLGQGAVASIWCFGYDLDNMKARSWYDSQMPLFYLSRDQHKALMFLVSTLLQPARDGVSLLRKQIKAAWSERPGDLSKDAALSDKEYWQATEPLFYTLLGELVAQEIPDELPVDQAQRWYCTLVDSVEQIFDRWVLATSSVDVLHLQRVLTARKGLQEGFLDSKGMKTLQALCSPLTKEA